MRMAARLVLCTAVLSLAPAGAAFAQQYPPGACSISSNVTSAQAGSAITVTGTGFPAGPVDITVNGQLVTTATAASDFQATFQIPANATPPFVIRATSGDVSCAATLTLSPTAAGARAARGAGAGGGALAFTGSDMQLVWIGLAALMTGLALVVAARRRAASRSRLSTIS